jgi:hypothetical protein
LLALKFHDLLSGRPSHPGRGLSDLLVGFPESELADVVAGDPAGYVPEAAEAALVHDQLLRLHLLLAPTPEVAAQEQPVGALHLTTATTTNGTARGSAECETTRLRRPPS